MHVSFTVEFDELVSRLCVVCAAAEENAEALARPRECTALAAVRETSITDCTADHGLRCPDIFLRLLVFVFLGFRSTTLPLVDVVLLAAFVFVEDVGAPGALARVPAASAPAAIL